MDPLLWTYLPNKALSLSLSLAYTSGRMVPGKQTISASAATALIAVSHKVVRVDLHRAWRRARGAETAEGTARKSSWDAKGAGGSQGGKGEEHVKLRYLSETIYRNKDAHSHRHCNMRRHRHRHTINTQDTRGKTQTAEHTHSGRGRIPHKQRHRRHKQAHTRPGPSTEGCRPVARRRR